ncbi:MAG: type III-B CRISPR-associated protein Cas10/Cmr2 [Candidatus Aenigmatarchaeota archaeon]
MGQNNKSVFGFTIGPIYELMSSSRKTRELWFSSFFFSWYVKRLIELLSSIENGSGTACFDFFIPLINSKTTQPQSKAGLFPDHIIGCSYKDKDETYNLIKSNIDKNNQFFISLIDNLGKSSYLCGKSKTDVNNIFIDYINTNFIVLPADKVNKNKIVEEVDNYLDGLERNRSFTLKRNIDTCHRCKFLPSVFGIKDDFDKKRKSQHVCPFCFLKFKCHNSNEVSKETGQSINFRYPSTGEISAWELIKNINNNKLKKYLNDYDELFFEIDTEAGRKFSQLLPKNIEIKPYHKYLAIVQVDGDNLGKTAKQVDDPKILSQLLFDFGLKAKDITVKYHGEPVYIGGDDILAFLPAAFKEDKEEDFKTVIDYVIELSEEYKSTLKKGNISGSLSAGIHLFYYKHPLAMALKNARRQLFDVAKKIPGKNSFSLLLTQHSGQCVNLQFKFDSDDLNEFNSLLKDFVSGKKAFPQGIHHKLGVYQRLITSINSRTQLNYFFENRFNEEIHNKLTGLEEIKNILIRRLNNPYLSGANLYTGEEALKILNRFLSELRFIKFLVGESK